MPESWSRLEVEAAVADYFDMLRKELVGVAYNKRGHARALAARLNGRSISSIEFKRENLSAVLIELGCPSIRGYKPLPNYQGLLRDVVLDWIERDASLRAAVESAVAADVARATVPDLLDRLEEPPELEERAQPTLARDGARAPVLRRIDYLEREARNISLGRAGEEFVAEFETARLRKLGLPRLAERVDHVAATIGDGLGYDIRSYDEDGAERLIEVKTTSFGKWTPFFVTRNELETSIARERQFHLYRLFDFRRDPRLYSVRGSLARKFQLEPISYRARPA